MITWLKVNDHIAKIMQEYLLNNMEDMSCVVSGNGYARIFKKVFAKKYGSDRE